MKLTLALALCAALTGLAAPALADDCSGRDHTAGTVLGAAGGAAIGGAASHNAGGAIAGAVIGGLAGNAIARSQDCDRARNGYDHGRRDDVRVGEYYQPSYLGQDENDFWGVESYEDFNNDYRHIWREIRQGRDEGSLSRHDADRYIHRLQRIRQRADWEQRSGRFNPEEIEGQLRDLRREIRWTRREDR